LIVAAIVIAADQLTKIWAVAALSDGPINVFGEFLQLRVTRNPGAAFSSFTGGGPILGVVAAAVAVGIAFLLPKIELRIDRFALSLIMGGALGNFTDRVFRGEGFLDGAVVDFIDFSFFPSFNVADSAISIGVALILLSAFLHRETADVTETAVGEQAQQPEPKP
jgi:signal peptidase II